MQDLGMSQPVDILTPSHFLQFLLYHTPHSPLPLFLLLAAHSAFLARIQLLGYNKRHVCNCPHSGSLIANCCTTAGGHTPCRQVLVRCVFIPPIRAI